MARGTLPFAVPVEELPVGLFAFTYWREKEIGVERREIEGGGGGREN